MHQIVTGFQPHARYHEKVSFITYSYSSRGKIVPGEASREVGLAYTESVSQHIKFGGWRRLLRISALCNEPYFHGAKSKCCVTVTDEFK